jgi:hypothetical protein
LSLLQSTLDKTLAAQPADATMQSGLLTAPPCIEQALAAPGTASRRRYKPAVEHAVRQVIGLVLFRHMPLRQVVQEMALTLAG